MTNEEIVALKKVRDGLASGQYQHYEETVDGKRGFNMNSTCGTVACIGGWMAVELSLRNQNSYVMDGGFEADMGRLFFPNGMSEAVEWEEITPQQAVRAIDSFLLDGNPRWNEAVSDES